MSTDAAITRRRDKENAKRKAERAVSGKRAVRSKRKCAFRQWEEQHLARLESARAKGIARVAVRFGAEAKEREAALKAKAKEEQRKKGWANNYITRLFKPAELREISTIDGEWVPPEKFTKFGKGKTEISEPIESRMFGCFDGFKYYRYKTLAALIRAQITSANAGRWFFAHGGGRADFLFLLNNLLKPRQINRGGMTWKIDEKIAGGRILFITVSHGRYIPDRDYNDQPKKTPEGPVLKWHTKETWTFIDSTAIFPLKLAEIGETIGMGKAKGRRTLDYLHQRFGITDLDKPANKPTRGWEEKIRKEFNIPAGKPLCIADLEKLSPKIRRAFYATAPLGVLSEYNKRDCVILWRALDKYQSTLLELGGQMQKTGAASSLDLFRRAYLRDDIRTSDEINNLIEFGGGYVASRVEAFRPKFVADEKTPQIYRHDINSSFPASTLRPMPGELSHEESGPIATKEFCRRFDLVNLKKNPVLLAYLSIEVPDDVQHAHVPPLPIYTAEGNISSRGHMAGLISLSLRHRAGSCSTGERSRPSTGYGTSNHSTILPTTRPISLNCGKRLRPRNEPRSRNS